MRRHILALSALAAATALMPVGAQAQATRATELPGNKPIAAYSQQQRDFMRGYVRQRPASEWQQQGGMSQTSATSPSGANNGGNIALGANVPSSMVLRDVQGNAEYSNYRYGRMGNQYIVTDRDGRVVDTFE